MEIELLLALGAGIGRRHLRVGKLTRRHETGTSKSEAANVHCADL